MAGIDGEINPNQKATDNHSTMIIGGLATIALSLFGGGSFVFNPLDPTLALGLTGVLHGFGINIPILDRILGSLGAIFGKK